MDRSPPGSSVRGILQARIWEWVALPSSRDVPDPEIEPPPLTIPALVGGFFTTSAIWEAALRLQEIKLCLIMLTFLKAFIFNREQCVHVNPELPVHPPRPTPPLL